MNFHCHARNGDGSVAGSIPGVYASVEHTRFSWREVLICGLRL